MVFIDDRHFVSKPLQNKDEAFFCGGKYHWETNITVEMMLDEEVYEDGLEVKSPQWQNVEVGNLTKKLDKRKWRIAVFVKDVSYPMLG